MTNVNVCSHCQNQLSDETTWLCGCASPTHKICEQCHDAKKGEVRAAQLNMNAALAQARNDIYTSKATSHVLIEYMYRRYTKLWFSRVQVRGQA